MTSAYREIYLDTCNMLFETYSKLIAPLTEVMEEKFPKTEETSKAAYIVAVRAKVLDCLRGLLPASTLTNMGIYGNGRFFEGLIQKLHGNNLAELQEIGKKSFEELNKIIPSFVRRSEASHRHCKAFGEYMEKVEGECKELIECMDDLPEDYVNPGVRLVGYDSQAVEKVAAAMLFSRSSKGLPELQHYCSTLSSDEIEKILDVGAANRENRRHKSPRALEHAHFTFEIIADYGIYRDLQRHRMLTQERQLLTCNYGYYFPSELEGTEMEQEYCRAMEKAKEVYNAISDELPEEAQYVVPMAYNIRWYFHVNLRSLQWITELRSSAQGHSSYRYVAQEMAKQVSDKFPSFERYFKFVDYDGHELGRLKQEERIQRSAEKRRK